jgi:hypothetical protein
VAVAGKIALQMPDTIEGKRRMGEFTDRFAKSASKAVACLEQVSLGWPVRGMSGRVI